MEEKARKCKECGKNIYGRVDKKFCNDTCRATFSNRKYRSENREILTINRILKRNYSILKALSSKGITKCTTRELYLKGFDFGYFTSANPDTNTYFCYNIEYQIVLQDLITKTPEMASIDLY